MHGKGPGVDEFIISTASIYNLFECDGSLQTVFLSVLTIGFYLIPLNQTS